MTTLATFRQRSLRSVGLYKGFTTTTAGASDGSTIICSSLLEYPDNILKGWYVKTTSGATQTTKRVKANDQTTGTIQVDSPFAAQIATSVTFELHQFDPADITTFINEAIDDAYPALCKPIVDVSLVSHNILFNSNFEDWASATAPDCHTVATATAAAEGTIKKFGSYALKMSVAAGSVYQTSDTYPHLLKMENGTYYFYAWVNTAAASNARISVYTKTQGGTEATTYSGYHTGGGEFELLECGPVTVPDDLAEIKFSYVTATTDAAYFDNAYCDGGWQEYLLPTQLDRVFRVFECDDADEPGITEWEERDFEVIDKAGTKYIRVYGTYGNDRLELHGCGKFATLSADTDTITPISEAWERGICALVTAKVLENQGSMIGSRDIDQAMKLAQKYEKKYEDVKKNYRMAVSPVKKSGSMF